MFKDKAYDLGKRLLPAFNTATGIPHSIVNFNEEEERWGEGEGGERLKNLYQ